MHIRTTIAACAASVLMTSPTATTASALIKALVFPTAPIWGSGNTVIIRGPLGCPKGQVIAIRVRVSEASGVTGEGSFSGDCTGKDDTWMAIVRSTGLKFARGKAHAHAWATRWTSDGAVKSWDWQRDVTLNNAGQ